MIRIDFSRIRELLEQNPPLDACTAYYRQYEAEQQWIGPLVPSFRDVLRSALARHMLVLDIGCGRGDTLLDFASLIGHGTGLDESGDVMIAAAQAARKRRGIGNVDFVVGKAARLPFADRSFDIVFTERGPVAEATIQEAIRVLRPGGLIAIETIGEMNAWESRLAFDDSFQKPTSSLGILTGFRDVFERNAVRIQVLASCLQTMRFPDIYEWLKYQCYTWNYPPRSQLSPDRPDRFERLAAAAGDAQGRIHITRHTIWVGGSRADDRGEVTNGRPWRQVPRPYASWRKGMAPGAADISSPPI